MGYTYAKNCLLFGKQREEHLGWCGREAAPAAQREMNAFGLQAGKSCLVSSIHPDIPP